MAKYTSVSIKKELLQTIFEGAKILHPKETILLLRGNKKKEGVIVTDLIIPPLAHYGRGSAHIALHMLPMDFSIIGTVHSHPSGNPTPSHTDLNNFLGTILMIVGFPFKEESDAAVYNRNGEKLALNVTEA